MKRSGLVPFIFSPHPSPSLSAHWVGSSGNASNESAYVSPSLSGHPKCSKSSITSVVELYTDAHKLVPYCPHLSAWNPLELSPYPSPSASNHWLASFGNASAIPVGDAGKSLVASDHPSPSESGHPKRSQIEFPGTPKHPSEFDEKGWSPTQSSSSSGHEEGRVLYADPWFGL